MQDRHITEIHAHAETLRLIARRLIRDVDVADEVAQSALLSLMKSPTRVPAAARAWLTGVVRNHARKHFRAESLRREHEKEAEADARSRGERVAEDVLVRHEMRERLARLVAALPEAQRTVILMRYMDDLPPQEIARQLDRPLTTVKSQLRRGLLRLREDLDAAAGGDRRAWLLALAPVAWPNLTALPAAELATHPLVSGALKSTTATTTATAASTFALAAIVIGGLSLALGSFLIINNRDSGARTAPGSVSSADSVAATENTSAAARRTARPTPPPSSRQIPVLPSPENRPSSPAATPAPGIPATASLLVRDALTASPVTGVRLEAQRGPAWEVLAESDAEGRLALVPPPADTTLLVLRREGYLARAFDLAATPKLPTEIPLRRSGALMLRRSEGINDRLRVRLVFDDDRRVEFVLPAGQSRYLVPDIRPGPLRVIATSEGEARRRFGFRREVPVGGQLDLDLDRPLPTRRLRVRFQTPPRTPMRWSLETADGEIIARAEAMAGAETMSLGDVPSGLYRLLARPLDGGADELLRNQPLTLGPGRDALEMNIRLPEGALTVSYPPAAEETWEAFVVGSHLQRRLMADGPGRWRAEGLSPGKTRVLLRSGNRAFTVPVRIKTAAAGGTTIALAPLALRPVVLNLDPGEAARVGLFGLRLDGPAGFAKNAGRLEFELGPGDWTLTAGEDRARTPFDPPSPPARSLLRVPPGVRPLEIDVTDHLPRIQELRVTRAGQPLAWTELRITPIPFPGSEARRTPVTEETNAEGRARFRVYPGQSLFEIRTSRGDQRRLRLDNRAPSAIVDLNF